MVFSTALTLGTASKDWPLAARGHLHAHLQQQGRDSELNQPPLVLPSPLVYAGG
jgi:hypothetical protein